MTAREQAVIQAAKELAQLGRPDAGHFSCPDWSLTDFLHAFDYLQLCLNDLNTEPPTLQEEAAERDARKSDHDYDRRENL